MQSPQHPLTPTRPALVCAICNQKGGVGKTTTTYHLARAAVVSGLKVLVIDMDPQGNATSALAAEPLEKSPGVAHTISPEADHTLGRVIVRTIWTGADLAPTPNTDDLAYVERQIGTLQFGREYRLADALQPVLDDYDLVLVDNQPSLGMLLINSLVAADQALIVTQPEQWSADGLAELNRTIDLVRRFHNGRLQPMGPLINGYRRSTHHNRIITEEIIPYYGEAAWTKSSEIIPLRTGITDYLLAGMGLDQGREAWMRELARTYQGFVVRMLQAGGRI